MKLKYTQRWVIKDKRISELDKQRIQLNKLTSMLYYQTKEDPQIFISLTTLEKRRKLMKKMQREIKKIYNSTQYLESFDELVLRDIEATVRKTIAEDDYFYNMKVNKPIGNFLSKVFGRAAYSRLLNMAKPENLDHKAIHKKYALLHSVLSRSLDSEIILERTTYSRLRGLLESQLNDIKKVVDSFYVSLGMLDKNPEYTIELAPSNIGFSYWEGHNFLMAIDPDKIFCYNKAGKEKEYIFNRAFAFVIGVHELAHGLEEKISENMPSGLRYAPETYNSLCHGVVTEGVALEVEKFFISWAKQHQNKYKFSKFDLDLMNYYIKSYIDEKVPWVFHDISELQEIERDYNPKLPEQFGIKAHKKLASVTRVKRYQKDYYLFNDREFSETLDQMIYIFGKEHISNLIEKIKKVIDIRSCEGKRLAIQAIATGFWCDAKAQEHFILEHYLPRAEKDGLIENP